MCFCLSIILLCSATLGAKESPAFAPWVGKWEGEMTVYSATGDRLDTLKVSFISEPNKSHGKGLQRLSMVTRSGKGHQEKQSGYYLLDSVGLRRILKTESGEPASDLRGRSLGPGKIYWYSIDTEGVLREAYIETVEDDFARIEGFRWDGQRSGSYRIVEGKYQRKALIAAADQKD